MFDHVDFGDPGQQAGILSLYMGFLIGSAVGVCVFYFYLRLRDYRAGKKDV